MFIKVQYLIRKAALAPKAIGRWTGGAASIVCPSPLHDSMIIYILAPKMSLIPACHVYFKVQPHLKTVHTV